MLGSIDANTGSPDLGWDTDQFPMDVKNSTLVMKVSFCSFVSPFNFRVQVSKYDVAEIHFPTGHRFISADFLLFCHIVVYINVTASFLTPLQSPKTAGKKVCYI